MSPSINDDKKFKNGKKQIWKEAFAVLGMMFILALVSFLLAWFKGHLAI